MATLAYQVSGFAYQGAGLFAYQGGAGAAASNWQADYWKRKSKKERDEDELEERIRLGILPPEARQTAIAAVVEADQAARQMVAGEISAPEALLQAMEAREAYENAYREVYKEAYIAEVVANLWREDMKRITRRRKAIALLLH